MAIEKKIKISLDATSAKKGLDDLANKLNKIQGGAFKASNATSKYTSEQNKLNKSVVNTNRSLNAFKGLLSKVAAAATVLTGIRLADDFNELQNKLRITLQEGEKLLDVQNQLIDVSLKTRSGLQDNALLYLRLSNSVDRTKVSQQELFRITESVNKAIQLGGSNAQEAQGALRQFTQIVSSGFVTGFSQELNSIVEQTPGLFKLLTDGLRETSQEFRDLEASGLQGIKILKEFSEKGIGDIDMLLAAIASQAENVDKQFANVNITVSKSIKNVRTALEEYIGTVDDATGFTERLALKINEVALNFDSVAKEIFDASLVMASGVITVQALTTALNLLGKSIIFVSTVLKVLLSKKSIKSLFTLASLAAGGLRLLKIAILAAGIAIAYFTNKYLKTADNGFIKFNGRLTTVNKLLKAVGVTIKEFTINTFVSFIAFMKSIPKFFSDAISKMATSWFNFVKYISETPFAKDIKELTTITLTGVKDFINAAIRYFIAMKNSIKEIFSVLFKEIKDGATRAAVDLKLLPEKIKALAAAITDTGAFLRFSEIQKKAYKEAGVAAEDSTSNIKEIFKNALDEASATDYIGDFVDGITGKVSELTTSMISFAEGIGDGVGGGFEAILQKIKNLIQSIKDEIASNLEDIRVGRGFKDDEINLSVPPAAVESWDTIIDKIKNALSWIKKYADNITAIGNAVVAFTDLFATLSSIRQDKLDEELRTSTDLSDEERKTKEANAKKAFETTKKLTLAGIALQTGLAIMNALADTSGLPWYVKAANAAAAAATGIAQYAKANSQQYAAPSAPSAGVSSASQVNNNNSTTTINITAGTASGSEIAQALQQYINNEDGIIINPESTQARIFS